jgi:DNA (cytosine-5)-methyltransferase 1
MNMRAAEFFAGIGLMRLGLERAGWNVVWANDLDPDKEELYKGHFGDVDDHFVLQDVHTVQGADLPDVELATASFPCTDLSLAGARRGLNGSSSGAFWGFVEVIRGMGRRKPRLILLENVTGFLTSHGGSDFRDACLALNELGYAVDPFIIDAASFVPQSRQRLFVVGNLGVNVTSLREESPRFMEGPCRPPALADFILLNPDIQWAVRPLPALPQRMTTLPAVLDDLGPESEYWWSTERAEYLLNQMSERHRVLADTMIAGSQVTYGTVFRRVRNGRSMAELRTDGVAGCLRTPRGGSGRQILFAAGKGHFGVRLLTARECSRLMGAGEFRLSAGVSLNQALFGFGDAVCVSVVEWIATHYLNPILQEFHGERPTQSYPKYRVRCAA